MDISQNLLMETIYQLSTKFYLCFGNYFATALLQAFETWVACRNFNWTTPLMDEVKGHMQTSI